MPGEGLRRPECGGCLCCEAHTLLGAHNFGGSDGKLAVVWTCAGSALYSERERAALDFAVAAASQPNAVTNEVFGRVRQHWSEDAADPQPT